MSNLPGDTEKLTLSFPSPRGVVFMGIAVVVTGLVLGIQGLGILQLLEWAILDYGFRRRPLEVVDAPVVIIAIDDEDIAANGQWPFSDYQLAQVLTRIKHYQPAAIGLDIYRDLTIEPGAADLTDVFNSTPNLIGIEKVVGERATLAVAPPPGLAVHDQVAFNDLVLDRDGHIRRHIISLRHDNQLKFALGAKLALLYLEAQHQIVAEPLQNNRIRLGQTEFSPIRAHSGGYVNADLGGYQILANYFPKQGIPTVRIQDVMSDHPSPEHLSRLLQDKIVLLGLNAESNWGDRFFTPYSNQSDETWAGVEIHANLAAQLISSALTGRSPLRPWPEALEWGWILLWASLGVGCNRQFITNWRMFLRLPFLTGALIGITYGFFLGNYWIPLMTPVLALNGAWVITQGYVVWNKLRQDNYNLEQTVQQRTQEIRKRNQDLIQARMEAELANQAKSQFLAHISHELRTPLTAILGFGDLLKRSPHLPAEEKDHAATINQSGEHLLALINNVLELSTIETGAITLNPQPICLSTLLTDVVQMFQAQSIAKDLALTLDLSPNVPDWIDADGRKICQVLINLVGNAVKFTSAGSVTLSANGYQNGSTTMVECSVNDTGPGLTAAEIDQLFHPFVQTSAGRKLGKGTGLGLALAQQYIELMGGTIQVSSVYGKGSQFSFQIPVTVLDKGGEDALGKESTDPGIAHHDAHPIISPKGAETQSIAVNYRVLIVDDEIINRKLLEKWLLVEGKYDIKIASTGLEALDIFEQWHPQLILLDIHLPDISGYDVARRIRTQCALQSDELRPLSSSWLDDDELIIIAVTAGILQDNYAQLLAAGCDDVLWKPLDADSLWAKLSDYCASFKS